MFVAALLLQAGFLYERFRSKQADEFRANLEMAGAVAGTFNMFVQNVLHQELAIGINLTGDKSFSVEQINRILETNKSAMPSIRNFAWLTPEGRIVASSMESIIGVDENPFIYAITQGNDWAVSDLLLSHVTGELVFSISRGMRDSDGRLLGIVMAVIRADQLGSILGLDLTQSGAICILDGGAMVVDCYPKRELKWEDRDVLHKRPAIRQALEGQDVTGIFQGFSDGHERIVTCTPSRLTKWVVCLSRSKSEVMAPVRSQAIQLSCLSLILTAVIFIAAFFISDGIVDPIRRLRDYARALGRGDPAERVEFEGSVELEDLASSFNRMAEEVGSREEALRKSEEKYRELVENANCIIARVNLDGTIIFFNEFAQKFFGYSEEEILGRHLMGTILPETDSAGQDLRKIRNEVMRSPDLHAKFENENVLKNSDRVWVMWAIKALLDEDGKVCGMLCIGTDITARKRIEDNLRKSEQEKAAILDSLRRVAVYYLDPDMRVIWTNASSKLVFGLTHEELKEKKCYEVIHGLSEACPDCTAIQAIQTGEAQQGEISRNGKTWLVSSNPVKDSTGKVTNVVHAAMNITDRKRMEEALRTEISERRQAERMQRLDEARLEALWQLSQVSESSTNQIAEFALEQTVKLTKSEVGWIGFLDKAEKELTVHVWPETVERVAAGGPIQLPVERADAAADAILEKRVVVINDFSISHPDTKYFLGTSLSLSSIMIVPIFENERVVAVAGVGNKAESYEFSDARQITLLIDGMWKIIQRQRSEKSLRESKSLAAMGRAMAAVAHDMKTPLIAIGGFARLAQRRIEGDSPIRDQLEIVVRETQRMENMVKGMVDFSRPLELECSFGDVSHLVSECFTLVAPLAQDKKVRLSTRIDPDTHPDVCLDFMRMKQALINILNNAIQASPEGEEVIVECIMKAGKLLINVIDCGDGIPFDKRQEIFSPFYTSKKEGAGLGLPIVKKIIDAHFGRIQIYDNPDKGITFQVEIPADLSSHESLQGCDAGAAGL